MRNFKNKLCLLIYVLFLNPGVSAAEDRIEEDRFASVRDKFQTCFACHGENGHSTVTTNPILAGQEFYYLYVQLKDFKSGLRESLIMGPLVENIAKEDLRLIAEFFGEQEWKGTEYTTPPEQVAAGNKLADSGQCATCHLGKFEGDSRNPRLSGQHLDYLLKTMSDFKYKRRNNAQPMNSLFGTYSDDEIKAIAEYLAGFK